MEKISRAANHCLPSNHSVMEENNLKSNYHTTHALSSSFSTSGYGIHRPEIIRKVGHPSSREAWKLFGSVYEKEHKHPEICMGGLLRNRTI